MGAIEDRDAALAFAEFNNEIKKITLAGRDVSGPHRPQHGVSWFGDLAALSALEVGEAEGGAARGE